jgi:methylmalonyl-CoA/ethylmalonyl-CoA epimerase
MISDLKFHHLGIATKSIEKCVALYRKLGYTFSETKDEPTQNVRVAFLSKEGSPVLELVESKIADSPISRIVQQSGTTPYHTCYEVEDILVSIDELEDLNFRPLFEPIKTEAMEDGLFCYLFSVDIGLIELYQKAK